MQVFFFIFVFTFLGGAFAAPKASWYDSSSSYTSSDDDFPFGYTGGAFAGAAAGPWVPFGYPYSFFNPFAISWPTFKPITPWYKGDNVCTTEEIINMPEKVQSWFRGDDSSSTGSRRKSQNCEGEGDKYICFERMSDENGFKMKATSYLCCSGFTLDPSHRQCVKKSSDDHATTTDAPTPPVKSTYHRSAGDRFSYVFSSSDRDTTRGSDVEKVPPQ